MRIKYIPNPGERFADYTRFIEQSFPQFLSEAEPDLLLVCGGDGAMLRAIQQHKHYNKPFLGKAAGTMNFLLNEIESDLEFLHKLEAGEQKLETHKFKTICAELLVGQAQNKQLAEIVNDLVLGSGLNGYHEFVLNSADKSFADFFIQGTGLCLSTTLGSTAYNFSNGGKVLPLDSNLWSLTGVVCNRNLNDILPEQKLEITFHKIKDHMKVYIDGVDQGLEVLPGMKLILAPAGEVELAFTDITRFISKRQEIGHRHRR